MLVVYLRMVDRSVYRNILPNSFMHTSKIALWLSKIFSSLWHFLRSCHMNEGSIVALLMEDTMPELAVLGCIENVF